MSGTPEKRGISSVSGSGSFGSFSKYHQEDEGEEEDVKSIEHDIEELSKVEQEEKKVEEEEENLPEEAKAKRDVDKWKKLSIPECSRPIYTFLFLETLSDEDDFAQIMRKLMLVAAFLFSPCMVAVAIWWLYLAITQIETEPQFYVARIIAAVAASCCGLLNFIPCWAFVRFGSEKHVSEALLNYWIIGIVVTFGVISICVPRWPTSIAAYALSEAAVLSRSTFMTGHVVLALILFVISQYNTLFIGRVDSWMLLGVPPAAHESTSVETLLMVFIGFFIVLLMAGALFLSQDEFFILLNRSQASANLSKKLASSLLAMQMKECKLALTEYRDNENSDAKLYNEFLSIVQTVNDFSKFAPKDVVALLLQGGGGRSGKHAGVSGLKLGMKPRNITIFFCDIAQFTTISEAVSSIDSLVQLMTAYFTVLGRLAHKVKSQIDKTIGDAIMILWNAVDSMPLTPHEQALYSISYCLHGQGLVRHLLRKQFDEAEGVHLSVRMGCHFGPASVGLIGSKERVSFTALGDSVNLAARLEGLGKYFRSQICISDDLLRLSQVQAHQPNLSQQAQFLEMLKQKEKQKLEGEGGGGGGSVSAPLMVTPFATRRLGIIAVKGKAEGVLVHQVIGVAQGRYQYQSSSIYKGVGGGSMSMSGSLGVSVSGRRDSLSTAGGEKAAAGGNTPGSGGAGGGSGGSAGRDDSFGSQQTSSPHHHHHHPRARDDYRRLDRTSKKAYLLKRKAEKQRDNNNNSASQSALQSPMINNDSILGDNLWNNQEGAGGVFDASDAVLGDGVKSASKGNNNNKRRPSALFSIVSGGDGTLSGGLGTSQDGTGGGETGNNSEQFSLDASMYHAQLFFRCDPTCCGILDQINSAQEHYESARFAEAVKIYDSLISTYEFPSNNSSSHPTSPAPARREETLQYSEVANTKTAESSSSTSALPHSVPNAATSSSGCGFETNSPSDSNNLLGSSVVLGSGAASSSSSPPPAPRKEEENVSAAASGASNSTVIMGGSRRKTLPNIQTGGLDGSAISGGGTLRLQFPAMLLEEEIDLEKFVSLRDRAASLDKTMTRAQRLDFDPTEKMEDK